MATDYPIEIADLTETVQLAGTANFTDPDNAPGVSVPDSWLTANPAAITASADLDWTLVAKAGDDLSIRVGTPSIIDIATAGVYEILLILGVLGDATGAGTVAASLAGTVIDTDWMDALGDPPVLVQTVTPANWNTDLPLTVPAFRIASAKTLTVNVSIVTGAGTITVVTATTLLVRRLQ